MQVLFFSLVQFYEFKLAIKSLMVEEFHGLIVAAIKKV